VEILARGWKSDIATATEWYRRCKPAFTPGGIPTEEEIKESLADEAQLLKLTESVPPVRIFDFTLQRAVGDKGVKISIENILNNRSRTGLVKLESLAYFVLAPAPATG
jgi:hypothetical protein